MITENEGVNFILNSKLAVCGDKGIHGDLMIIGDVTKHDEYDLISLLGNLLDNAIEACAKCTDPTIKLEIKNYKDYLSITVINSTAEPVLKNNPELKTTKKDKELHGIGLSSIQSVVDKYSGDIIRNDVLMNEKDAFKCSVLLKFPCTDQ